MEPLLLDPAPDASDSPSIDLHWRSFELRPPGSPPIPPAYLARIEAGRPQLQALARERYGVEMNSGPFGVDTRPALVGEKYAERCGLDQVYHNAVMRAYWEEAQDIGDRTVLAAVAASVGLDRDGFLAALDDPEFQGEMLGDVELAHRYGLNGVPALVFADKYLVSGAQPTAVLQNVLLKVVEEQG